MSDQLNSDTNTYKHRPQLWDYKQQRNKKTIIINLPRHFESKPLIILIMSTDSRSIDVRAIAEILASTLARNAAWLIISCIAL